MGRNRRIDTFRLGAALAALTVVVVAVWILARIGGAETTLWVDDGVTP